MSNKQTSNKPTNEFTYLWNDDTPLEERKRLSPFMMEDQILHIWQVKQVAIRNHKRHMKELDDWMNNIKSGITEFKRKRGDFNDR